MAERAGEESAGSTRPKLFISYASQDASIAGIVVEALESTGLTCWIAPRDVVPGALYAGEIVKAINECSLLVLILSAQSVASPHVGKELERAASKRRRIIALRTDSAELPDAFEYFLSESQWIEVGAGGVQQAAKRLTEAVLRHLGSEPAAERSAALAARPPDIPVSARLPRGKPVAVAAIAILALLLVAGGVEWASTHRIISQSTNVPTVASAPSSPETPAPTRVTLAVLPFANLSSDREQEYFSDGLTEEILNQLAQIKDLVVTGRTSSFSFKGKNEDLRVIATKLGVANLLEGSIRKEGNQLRITAQLINGKDGAHLWSNTYDRELSKVFVVQEDIARDVAQALSIRLDVGDMSRAKGGTTNLEAYDKYLRAEEGVERLGHNVIESARLYREATTLDPTFWRAWYGLVDALFLARAMAPDSTAAGDLARVRTHLIDAAPDSWAKQRMLSGYYFEKRMWAQFATASDAALASMPASDALARIGLALTLMSVGRIREAVEQWDRASKLDPLTTGPSTGLQVSLFLAGRADDAQAEYERSRGLSGDHSTAEGYTFLRQIYRPGATPESIKARLLSLPESMQPSQFDRRIVASLRDTQAVRTTIRKALEDPANQGTRALLHIVTYADYVGDRDTALTALRKFADLLVNEAALDPNDLVDLWVPFKTEIRTDPRFKTVVRDLGLVDYWRTSGNWGDYCRPVGKDDFECH